jgi:hypothetical protein
VQPAGFGLAGSRHKREGCGGCVACSSDASVADEKHHVGKTFKPTNLRRNKSKTRKQAESEAEAEANINGGDGPKWFPMVRMH